MGGYGSGRRQNSKKTTESQYRVDIRWLKKNGFLRPNTKGSLSWTSGGQESGTVDYLMFDTGMVLVYRHREGGGDWESIKQLIQFDVTPCNFGGHRRYFLCPQCKKRVAVLYGAGRYFLCRQCHGLTYGSQQEGKQDRLMRKARKIRRRLGASDNLFETISPTRKPKGMHWTTFDRLRLEAREANHQSLMITVERLGIQV